MSNAIKKFKSEKWGDIRISTGYSQMSGLCIRVAIIDPDKMDGSVLDFPVIEFDKDYPSNRKGKNLLDRQKKFNSLTQEDAEAYAALVYSESKAFDEFLGDTLQEGFPQGRTTDGLKKKGK